jgi:hypothetical protein
MWHTTDPRKERVLTHKHFVIIVSDGQRATTAFVDVDEEYYVDFTEVIVGRDWVSEKETWPPNLVWTDLPKV